MLLLQALEWLTLINSLLLITIFFINFKSYIKMKAEYTLFFLIFTGLFLLQNIVSGYYFVMMTEYYPSAIGNHMLILTVLQTIAFSYMLWMQRQ